MSEKPNRPMTMDGIPASRSTARPMRRFWAAVAYSLKYSPQPTPGNTARHRVSPTRHSVPAQAGHMPSHTGRRPSRASRGGVRPKNRSGPRAGSPRHSRYPIRANTGPGHQHGRQPGRPPHERHSRGSAHAPPPAASVPRVAAARSLRSRRRTVRLTAALTASSSTPAMNNEL